MDYMKIEQTTIHKTFYVKYCSKVYHVNYINLDDQTIALLNSDNWMIYDEEGEELQIYILSDNNKKQKEIAKKNIELSDKLIKYCIKHFNDF